MGAGWPEAARRTALAATCLMARRLSPSGGRTPRTRCVVGVFLGGRGLSCASSADRSGGLAAIKMEMHMHVCIWTSPSGGQATICSCKYTQTMHAPSPPHRAPCPSSASGAPSRRRVPARRPSARGRERGCWCPVCSGHVGGARRTKVRAMRYTHVHQDTQIKRWFVSHFIHLRQRQLRIPPPPAIPC